MTLKPLPGSDGDALYVPPRRELRSVLMRFNNNGRGMLALPRMNAHRMVVVAAALTTLVTALLASALAVLIGQTLPIATHNDLTDAGSGTSMTITGSVNASDDAAYNSSLPGQIRSALNGTPFTLYHSDWSDPLGFAPGTAPASGANIPILDAASLPDVSAHAVLVSGTWPTAQPAGGNVQAALPATAAALLHLSTGDTLQLHDRVSNKTFRFQITGVYRPVTAGVAATDYWELDNIGLSGSSTVGGFITFGPLTVQPGVFGSGTLTTDTAAWVVQTRPTLIPADQLTTVAGNVQALSAALQSPPTLPSLLLTTSLPSVLTGAADDLAVARSLLTICGVLLALLGSAVLLAVARLLYGQREGETAMMIARGATRGQLLRLSAAEALPLAVITSVAGAAAGIWLAGVLHPTSAMPFGGALLNAAEAAVAVAVGALIILLIPALSNLSPGAARARRGRQAAISTASKAGLDLGLIALAVLTCWQLRHYSAVSAGTSGTFGVDPVVVLAPALALAGGTVAALRLLPLAGKAGDRLAARGRHLVTALASWQISRQPLRQGGAALLIILAVATATLTLTQRQSWTQSDHDQAAFSAGADVRVQTVQPLTAGQAAAVTTLPGVRDVMPVANYTYALSTGSVLAVDAAAAPDVTLLRADQAGQRLSTLFGEIRDPDQAPGVALGHDSAHVRLTAQLGPATSDLGPATVSATVEDAHDVVYQSQPATMPSDGREHALALIVTPDSTAISYPLRLTAITVTFSLPASSEALTSFVVDGVSGLPGSTLRSFTAIASSADLASAVGQDDVFKGSAQPSVTANVTASDARTVTFETGYGLAANIGAPPSQLAGQLTLTALPPPADRVIPGIATRSFLSASSTSIGSTVQATLAGSTIGVRIVAAVNAFPTATGSGGTVIVDLAAVQNFLNGRSLPPAPVNEWWFTTAGRTVPAGLSGDLPSGSTIVNEPALTSALVNNPLSDVPQQALAGIAIAALALASTGFCVSIAAGVRQRRSENALLAALGLTPRAAAAQLCLEKFMLSLPSAAAGLILGALLSKLLVPAITLSSTATTPQPPVLIVFGWVPTLAAAVFLAVLPVLAAALVMVRRPDAAASLRTAEAA
jgi:FtsX-like permease family protein